MPTVTRLRTVAELGCGLLFPNHFYEWEELVNKFDRLLVLCARDHGKTTFFSILYPLYRCALDSNFLTCIISYSEDQAKRIIQAISDLVESRPLLQPLKPSNYKDTWSKNELAFSNRSKLIALSFGTSVRGIHPDLIVLDDPVKDFGGMNPEDQEMFFTKAITPMAKTNTQIIVTGTPVYDGDLIDKIETRKYYEIKKYPAISGNVTLWTERWNSDKLEQRRKEIGDFAFSREYLLQRVNSESAFFKKDWIKFYEFLPERMSRILSIDPAITAMGDYTALVATGTSEENKSYILECVNLRTESIQEILDEMFRLISSWSIDLVVIETVGFQRLLKHWVYEEMRKRNVWFGLEELKSYNRSKQARVMSLQPRIQSGSLLFGRNQSELVDQLTSFPHCRYDDLIDSLSMQVNYWDLPDKVVAKSPQNSWEWWAKKVDQDQKDYRDLLFRDLEYTSPDSNLILP